MFNKKKCEKCKFHGRMMGSTGYSQVFCYYSAHNQRSCLERDGKRIKDRRGNDPNECKLFESGKSDSIAKKNFLK